MLQCDWVPAYAHEVAVTNKEIADTSTPITPMIMHFANGRGFSRDHERRAGTTKQRGITQVAPRISSTSPRLGIAINDRYTQANKQIVSDTWIHEDNSTGFTFGAKHSTTIFRKGRINSGVVDMTKVTRRN
eukprot:gnl/MRDRNA2_/MRDRNA2_416761_c0_seq1.p1 gnl/MRDRNA2_/MRDRNA2_416761_c0~~gnl/MRDRNA2_/MRDRNA2_416761_c0_seq1.p1  ORF type:complete len:131 (+),score=13.41 gnl/MRDRNA2_/MRDRNA2_416761_c0_seq1:57-449(+)